jgi:hypothetical protein
MNKYEVFISYNHVDKNFIDPIAKLVRALRPGLVFQDIYDIEPGDLWEQKLKKALNEAIIVALFWCQHSEKSAYVKTEYETAMEQNKKIVLFRFDDTPPPSNLGKFEWVNLGNNIHNTKGYVIKFSWNLIKKFLVRMIPALSTYVVIEDIKGPNEIANSIKDALDKLIPPTDEP